MMYVYEVGRGDHTLKPKIRTFICKQETAGFGHYFSCRFALTLFKRAVPVDHVKLQPLLNHAWHMPCLAQLPDPCCEHP